MSPIIPAVAAVVVEICILAYLLNIKKVLDEENRRTEESQRKREAIPRAAAAPLRSRVSGPR